MDSVSRRQDLRWTADGQDWVMRSGGKELARVVPDKQYHGMWRIRTPDGRLSDMVNLSRAQDAATAMAVTNSRAARERPEIVSGAGS
jgi:hypothetical protein